MRAAIPNLLSACRLLLGIAFPLVPASLRFAVLVVAGLTEFLDGALSRWWRVASSTGRVLDPIADKVFVLSVLGTLAHEGRLALWELPLVGARDIMVLGGCVYVAARHGFGALSRVPPRTLGKLATTCQLVYLVLALLGSGALRPVLFVTAAVSIAAGCDYLLHGGAAARQEPEASEHRR